MAKYTVTCACGHEYTAMVYDPPKQLKSVLDKYRQSPCPKCLKASGAIYDHLEFYQMEVTYQELCSDRYNGCGSIKNFERPDGEHCIILFPDESKNHPFCAGLYGSRGRIAVGSYYRHDVLYILETVLEQYENSVAIDADDNATLTRRQIDTLRKWHRAQDIISIFEGIFKSIDGFKVGSDVQENFPQKLQQVLERYQTAPTDRYLWSRHGRLLCAYVRRPKRQEWTYEALKLPATPAIESLLGCP